MVYSTLTCFLSTTRPNTHTRGELLDPVLTFYLFPNKPTVTLQPPWTQIYSGETVTVRCEIQGGEGAQWTYEWRRGQVNTGHTSNEYRIITVTESDSGGYSCRGRRDYMLTEWSDIITLTVSCKLEICFINISKNLLFLHSFLFTVKRTKHIRSWKRRPRVSH
uniref:Ig-like domain-containing protein n=1 Tax=Maylandia zebra TaxID=106582 RepID=A0A3P9DBH9_9CICH